MESSSIWVLFVSSQVFSLMVWSAVGRFLKKAEGRLDSVMSSVMSGLVVDMLRKFVRGCLGAHNWEIEFCGGGRDGCVR